MKAIDAKLCQRYKPNVNPLSKGTSKNSGEKIGRILW
jgi:hypothetical protein